MSLRDLEEIDEEEEIEAPKRRKRGRARVPRSVKIGLAILVIGIILGVALGQYALDPVLEGAFSGECAQCMETKELLTLENQCLYNYINDAQIIVDGCST